MELQQRSSRRSKHSSRRSERPAQGWTPIQIARIAGFAIVAAAPWYYGAAPWVAQYWMVWGALIVAILLLCELLRRFWSGLETQSLSMPSLSYVAIAVAAIGWLQALPLFTAEKPGGWAPPSVEIQRWFLGVPIAKLDAHFNTASNPSTPNDSIETFAAYPDARLALSVEPLHSRAAVGSVATIAVMLWLGSASFRTERSQLALLIFMTMLGVGIGLLGLANSLSWEKINWLGLDGSLSFATFVSKNTAGGFLNVCFAASIGLAAWAFKRPREKEQRYAYEAEGPATRALRSVEEFFAQITTAQIAALLATTFILTCVLCTQSRGAIFSASAASLIALLLGAREKNSYGRWIFAFIVVALGLILIFYFNFDQRLFEGFARFAHADALKSDQLGGRIYIWGVALKAFLFFGVFGSGLGTFHFAGLPFQDPIVDSWYYHPESLFAQALVELGWFGVATIITALVMAFRQFQFLNIAGPQGFSRSRNASHTYAPLYLVGLTLFVTQTIHSFVDFALIVPAVFLPFALLLGAISGAAWQKRMVETQSPPVPSQEAKRSRHVNRLEEFDHRNRSGAAPDDAPMVATPQDVSWTRKQSILWVTCIATLLFLLSSFLPLDAMSRVEKMEGWLKEQEGIARASRSESPSEHLAGLWGNPMISISRVPSALRIIGESVLYQFRVERLDAFEMDAKDRTSSLAWEMTSPLIIRMAIDSKESESLSKSSGTKSFEKTSDFTTLMGGNEQIARWDKARELIGRAHLQSPLDWRLVWGRLLLDRRLSVHEWNGWFDRSYMLSRHRSETMFQIGVLGRQTTKDREHSNLVWSKAMQLTPSIAPRAASLIALDTSDAEIPVELFPPEPNTLYLISSNPFDKEHFPITNARIWKEIEEIALAMAPEDSNRFAWLARAASSFGKPVLELEYLEQAVIRKPLDRFLRLHWAERLQASGDLESALEQVRHCQSLAPEDPQIEAFLKNLKALSLKSSGLKNMN